MLENLSFSSGARFETVALHEHFVVLHKAPGVGMHDEDGVPGLVSLARDALGMMLYPVHRLDKVTSGLVLLARDTEANRELSMAFAERKVEKAYLAISDQKPLKKQGWVKGDMIKGRRGAWMLTRSQDNPAVTRFVSQPLEAGGRLFMVQPKTGKTHQIRVALKSLGAPILGDRLYAGTPADRVYLHAWRLSFPFAGQFHHYLCLPSHGHSFLAAGTQALLQSLCEPLSH